MRFHAHGVRFFAFHIHHSTHVILRTIPNALGAPCVIALLRAVAGGATFATLAATARVMWALPATADAVIAGIAAIAWTLWLDEREDQ